MLGVVLGSVLVFGGLLWRRFLLDGGFGIDTTMLRSPNQMLPTLHHPFLEVLKLVAAFLIGRLISSVQGHLHGCEAESPWMAQAQVLLCIAGALMMIIIGDSLARAFGVAGGAAIVRFRTSIENPRDGMVLFLLLGLGMACGLGAFALAGLGTMFLLVLLIYLEGHAPAVCRAVTLSVRGRDLESARPQVERILAERGIQARARGGAEGETTYRVQLAADADIEELGREIRAASAGIESLSWGGQKKGKKDRGKG